MRREPALVALLACSALSVPPATSVAGTAIHVNAAAGSDANTGQDWTNAKQTVTAGLAAAVSGDHVWVATGTYVECITLKNGVGLYGGFAGNETALDQRDWVTNKTILDGNKAGSVVTAPQGATATTRIDGFTIRNGSGTCAWTCADSDGGGVYCYYSSPTISNNTVEENTASGFGGGVYCYHSAPTMSDNIIKSNTAHSYGGGIDCTFSSPAISNNMITGNSAGDGGGVHCSSSSPTISNSTIAGNAAHFGGGIHCSSSSPTIFNSMITGNSATYGGGVNCYFSSLPTIVNSTIAGNSGVSGGAIYCEGSPTITNTIIAFNSSGIYRTRTGNPILRYNCVYGNASYNYSELADPTGSEGNISADPKLADPQYGNWHIRAGSPCIDAGDDSATEAGWLDVDGQPRIQGGHVDIGADEADGTTWPQGPHMIVRVSPGGDDANDGSGWTTPKRTVQAAIDANASAGGGDVWVVAGTYVERISLKLWVNVYGGFAGNEDSRNQRNWAANVTVLDGGAGGSVVTASSLPGYGLSTIDGFTIRNGTGTGLQSPKFGGGIYCYDSSPMISNNTIVGNTVSSLGGGIYCVYSSPTIANNMITGNAAYHSGGGISCEYSSPLIVNNTIVGNSGSSSYGGGIDCWNHSSPVIANTIIAFNSSGIYRGATYGSNPTLRYNCVYGNASYNYSGLGDPTGTNGNVSADPGLAAGRCNGVWHIEPGSPCVDAGDDGAVQTDWLDLDAQPRIQRSHVDIGADESDGTQPAAGPCAIVRVSPDGDDANDGSSWAAAKRTVQAGIHAASYVGGEVWVRAGTYLETITMRPFAHVYGGFRGDEAARDQRDFRANATILDGQQHGSVVTVQWCGYRTTTIDGFTITNGTGTLTEQGRAGGGICCLYSSPRIAGNTIIDNEAYSGGGGGIHCSCSCAMIEHNTIAGNTARLGGAIYCFSSFLTITNNTIVGNSTGLWARGGGIYCFSSSSPTISSNIVAFNSSGLYQLSSTPLLRDNCVYGNSRSNYGGMGDPTGTNGNIAVDPLFVRNPNDGGDGWGTGGNDDYGDVHLTADSPCINAGDDSAVAVGSLDMDGEPRIAYGRVDIGADEFLYRGPLDFDFDTDLDLTDFGFFRACFSGPNRPPPNVSLCSQADLDNDADVDVADFLRFQACFNGPNRPPRCE